jgi:hypothetical protein
MLCAYFLPLSRFVTGMHRPLREHIEFLQRRLERLNRRSMSSSLTREQLNGFETEIRAAMMALEHYRKALDLEKRVRPE